MMNPMVTRAYYNLKINGTGGLLIRKLYSHLTLIEKYKDKWYWNHLCDAALACLPKLSIQDIDEVMSHHFSLKQS